MLPFFEPNNQEFNCFISDPLIYPIHFHLEVELLYILEGFVDVDINKIPFRIHAGDFAVIFPGQLHEYCSQSEHARSLLALFQPELTPDYLFQLQNYEPQNLILTKEQCHPDIAFSMKHLWDEIHMPIPNKRVYPAYLQLVLARSIPLLELRPKQKKHYDTLLHQVIEFLSTNFTQPLTLADTAVACGVSKYHLSRVFSQQMKTSFQDYLNTLRINDAQIKLRTTHLPITDIAYLCGFDSPRSFNRNFVRIAGMTPSEYRNLHA